MVFTTFWALSQSFWVFVENKKETNKKSSGEKNI
jgi:hypothetical protein